MKKRMKIVIAVVVLVVVVIGTIFGIVKWREQQAMQEQLRVENRYKSVNNAFYIFSDNKKYQTYDAILNDDVSEAWVYMDLACYHKETGNVLALEEVKEYFSREFEEDGSLRLYDNGLHPEMEAYVNWALENTKTRDTYRDNIVTVYATYLDEKEIPRGERTPFSELTLDQLQELINKEADPNYELNI